MFGIFFLKNKIFTFNKLLQILMSDLTHIIVKLIISIVKQLSCGPIANNIFVNLHFVLLIFTEYSFIKLIEN